MTPIDPPYFDVGTLKLILVTDTAMGAYSLYWLYRKWRAVDEVADLNPALVRVGFLTFNLAAYLPDPYYPL